MSFIETLRSVGGVKPCSKCNGKGGGEAPTPLGGDWKCSFCHGTGQIIDLVPLLAKPKELVSVADKLLQVFNAATRNTPGFEWWSYDVGSDEWPKTFYIIGPQRASNLVYEVARQLNGTAVVAEPVYQVPGFGYREERSPQTGEVLDRFWMASVDRSRIEVIGYRLSLTIPPDATVLFVTDKIRRNSTDEEIVKIIRSNPFDRAIATGEGIKVLPYVLALVSRTAELDIHIDGKYMNVISLYKEKP